MRWVEIPIDLWLQECVSVSHGDVPVSELDELVAVEHNHQKGEMCPGLVQKLFNSWLFRYNCDTFSTFSIEPESHADDLETDSYSTCSQHYAARPDLVIYPTDVAAAKRAYELHFLEKKTTPADLEDEQTSSMTPLQDVETGSDASATRARMSWDWADLLIEVEHNEKRFPLTTDALDLQTNEAQQARGQRLAEYAAAVMGCQHRTFLFMVVVCGEAARLVRFDRNGALVSTSFDYMRKSSALGRFLYGLYSPRRSRKARGYDPTATLASDEDALLLRKACELFSLPPGSAQYFRLKESATSDSPIYKLSITAQWSEDGGPVGNKSRGSTKAYLVGHPLQLLPSIMGKGTRPFVACQLDQLQEAQAAADEGQSYNVELGAVVFIKDYWRVDSSEVTREQEVYRRLWESADHTNVQMFPTPIGGGDVRDPDDDSDTAEYSDEIDKGEPEADERSPQENVVGDGEEHGSDEESSGNGDRSEKTRSNTDGSGGLQMTLTQQVMRFADGEQPLLPRIHTRIIFKEVCRALEEFKDPMELLYVIYCAINAHRHAWESTGILHRDVSAGNILIYDQSGDSTTPALGLLSDWDLAKTKAELRRPATQGSRSGTWQFMSALLQQFLQWPHGVAEDLESFMHVLDWCILKFLPHRLSKNPRGLADFMRGTYDVSFPPSAGAPSNVHTGSYTKYMNVRNGVSFVSGLPAYEGPIDWSADGQAQTQRTRRVRLVHPVAEIVKLLSTLCKEHYETLDLPDVNVASSEDVFTVPKASFPAQSTARGWNLRLKLNDSKSTETGSIAQPPPPRRVVLPMPEKVQKESPLRNHETFLEAFIKVLSSELFGEEYNRCWPNFAKTPDQCPYYATSTMALVGGTRSRVASSSSNNSSQQTTSSASSSAVEGDDEPLSKRRRTEMDGRGLEVPRSGSVGHHAPRQPSPLSIPGNNSALGEGSGQGAAIPEAGPSTATEIRLGAKRTREY